MDYSEELEAEGNANLETFLSSDAGQEFVKQQEELADAMDFIMYGGPLATPEGLDEFDKERLKYAANSATLLAYNVLLNCASVMMYIDENKERGEKLIRVATEIGPFLRDNMYRPEGQEQAIADNNDVLIVKMAKELLDKEV